MKRSNERELFLKYIVNVYLKNSNLSISSDIIYGELSRFNVYNGVQSVIDKRSLVGVQVALNNKYRNNKIVNTFTSRGGYFWVVENRDGKSDDEFYSEIYDSIKLYVSVDFDNIYKISESLFNFMINENIVMQCKVSKGMRNDALVCRVVGKDTAIKVCDYLNNLNYESTLKPNPFLFDNDKVSIAMDGLLSYNSTLSKLLEQYFISKKNSNRLDEVNCSDFCIFVNNQIKMLNSNKKDYYMNLYGINSEDKYKDFIMVSTVISKNLDGTLSLENLFNYSETKNIETGKSTEIYSKQHEDKFLYVINSLTNYYSVDDVHKIIMKYIETGNVRYFTRKNDIRTIIKDNFSPSDIENIIFNLGYNAFISASKYTYDKYGEEQLFAAIKCLFNEGNLQKFTNDSGVRSRLGLVVPPQLLKKILISKLQEADRNISSISLALLTIEELNKLDIQNNDMNENGEKKFNGRK